MLLSVHYFFLWQRSDLFHKMTWISWLKLWYAKVLHIWGHCPNTALCSPWVRTHTTSYDALRSLSVIYSLSLCHPLLQKHDLFHAKHLCMCGLCFWPSLFPSCRRATVMKPGMTWSLKRAEQLGCAALLGFLLAFSAVSFNKLLVCDTDDRL